MKAWYILLPCILLTVGLIILFSVIIKLKRKSKTTEQTKDKKSEILKRNYKIVCLITGILALILFIAAIVIIATLGWIIVGMAMIICMLFLACVAGFCYAKCLTISVYQQHTKKKN